MLNPVWHRMLYSCIHVATVGVKRLMALACTQLLKQSATVHLFHLRRSFCVILIISNHKLITTLSAQPTIHGS